MLSVVRSLVVLVICVLLPLQAVAGLVMPFCSSGAATAQATHCDSGGPAHDAHLQGSDASSHHASGAEDPGSVPSSCDQCSLCHLACTGALPVSVPEVTAILRSVLRAAPQVNVSQFLPDPFLRPPRSGLA